MTSKRILIVEDEEDNLTLLIHILKYLLGQEEIVVARTGREAILLAYQEEPDVILMDITIPDLDGLEATRSLKTDDRFKSIPILAITAHAMVGDRESAIEAGFDGYIAKPLDLDQFLKFIKPYLSEYSSKDALK